MAEDNYFDILEVSKEASLAEIKRSYRRLVFKYHPDHNSSRKDGKMFNKINKAYLILSDPKKRDSYEKGASTAVTDNPNKIIRNYWEMICRKGFHKINN